MVGILTLGLAMSMLYMLVIRKDDITDFVFSCVVFGVTVIMWLAATIVSRVAPQFNGACGRVFEHEMTPAGSILYWCCLIPWAIGSIAMFCEPRTPWLVGSWLLLFVLMLAGAEVNMVTWVFEDANGDLVPLIAKSWGLGQIMAILLLAVQIWDVISYYIEHED